MKSSKEQEIEIGTFVERCSYEDGVVVVGGSEIKSDTFRIKNPEEENYETGIIRVEEPDEVIEPKSTILYEFPDSVSWEEKQEELRESIEELADYQDAMVFPVPTTQLPKHRYSREELKEEEEALVDTVEAYDQVVMGICCGDCFRAGEEGRLRDFASKEDVDALYATLTETYEKKGQQGIEENQHLIREDLMVL